MTGLVVLALFFSALGAATWVAWRWFRRVQGRWEAAWDALRTAGFVPAEDAVLAGRLRSSRSPVGTPVPGLLKRPGPGFTERVLRPPTGTTAPPAAVAIQSDRLPLPRFLLLPAARNGEGRGYGSDAHLHEILSPDTPELQYPPMRLSATDHTLSADDIGRVEPLFDTAFRAWLRTTEGLALRGDGDLLVVWLGLRGPGWAPVRESDPIAGLALARRAYEALRRRD